jgi:hypothetical protein
MPMSVRVPDDAWAHAAARSLARALSAGAEPLPASQPSARASVPHAPDQH